MTKEQYTQLAKDIASSRFEAELTILNTPDTGTCNSDSALLYLEGRVSTKDIELVAKSAGVDIYKERAGVFDIHLPFYGQALRMERAVEEFVSSMKLRGYKIYHKYVID